MYLKSRKTVDKKLTSKKESKILYSKNRNAIFNVIVNRTKQIYRRDSSVKEPAMKKDFDKKDQKQTDETLDKIVDKNEDSNKNIESKSISTSDNIKLDKLDGKLEEQPKSDGKVHDIINKKTDILEQNLKQDAHEAEHLKVDPDESILMFTKVWNSFQFGNSPVLKSIVQIIPTFIKEMVTGENLDERDFEDDIVTSIDPILSVEEVESDKLAIESDEMIIEDNHAIKKSENIDKKQTFENNENQSDPSEMDSNGLGPPKSQEQTEEDNTITSSDSRNIFQQDQGKQNNKEILSNTQLDREIEQNVPINSETTEKLEPDSTENEITLDENDETSNADNLESQLESENTLSKVKLNRKVVQNCPVSTKYTAINDEEIELKLDLHDIRIKRRVMVDVK